MWKYRGKSEIFEEFIIMIDVYCEIFNRYLNFNNTFVSGVVSLSAHKCNKGCSSLILHKRVKFAGYCT